MHDVEFARWHAQLVNIKHQYRHLKLLLRVCQLLSVLYGASYL